MSEAKGQAEPTMEEILASIRRIISEDDAEADQAEARAPGSEAADEAPEAAHAPEPESEPEPTAEPSAESEPESAPDLAPDFAPDFALNPVTDFAADAGTQASSAVEPEFEDEVASEEDDVLELTEKVEADGTVVNLAAERAAKGAIAASDAEEEGLVGTETAAATVGSLSELARAAIAGSCSRRGSVGDGRTLEDIVREALRPELKAWLDSNLPALVEQIVRDEIKRLVRRAEDR